MTNICDQPFTDDSPICSFSNGSSTSFIEASSRRSVHICTTRRPLTTQSTHHTQFINTLLTIYHLTSKRHPSHSFVHPVRYCYHDISWTAWTISMKLTGIIHWLLLMTWLDSGGQWSRSQQAIHGSEMSEKEVQLQWLLTHFNNQRILSVYSSRAVIDMLELDH